MPENAREMQISGRFQKGQSGNPRGRVKGTKNRVTIAAEHLLQGELENICRRLIEEALAGNIQAMKLVLDRILPSKKDRMIDIKLPKLQSSKDALKAISVITYAVSCGDITPSEGEAVSKIIDAFVKAIHTYDFDVRLNELESRVIQ